MVATLAVVGISGCSDAANVDKPADPTAQPPAAGDVVELLGDAQSGGDSLEAGERAQAFVDAVTAGHAVDFDPFRSPSEMLEASEFVVLGEVIDVEPGLHVEEENAIPDGYEPNEVIPEGEEGFASDPEADDPPARAIPDRSVWLAHVAIHIRVENSLSKVAAPGDILTVHLMSNANSVGRTVDVNYRGKVFAAGDSIPQNWSDNEQLHFDWRQTQPTPLPETYFPWQDGLWLETSTGILGLHSSKLFDTFGDPQTVDELFSVVKAHSTQ